MKQVKDFGLEDNVWEPSSWNGAGITNLWSKICHRLDTYLCTEGNSNKIGCMEEIREGGELENLIQSYTKNKIFESNRIRPRR